MVCGFVVYHLHYVDYPQLVVDTVSFVPKVVDG